MDRTRKTLAFTLVDLVVVLFILAVVASLLLPALRRHPHGGNRRIRCRNNLNQIAKGMATYLNEHGDNRFYPYPLGRTALPDTYNGAEWLASLYWSGVIPDPGVFICPSSPDTNQDGIDIGLTSAALTFGSQTISYAGMHYDSIDTADSSAIRDDYPPNKPMGSDDTQGDINHGTQKNGGMAILFFDSHVEFRTNTELDLERAVGDTTPGALLKNLSN